MRSSKLTLALIALMAIAQTNGSANAQGMNDFFGGGTNTIPGTNAAESALNNAAGEMGVKPGDFTDDEKRMQRKFKDRIKNAKDLISRGNAMMQSQKDPNHKVYKKGKILKEIGERDLGELNANNPFPTPAEKQLKQDNPDGMDVPQTAAKPEESNAAKDDSGKSGKRRFGLPFIGKKKATNTTTEQPSQSQ